MSKLARLFVAAAALAFVFTGTQVALASDRSGGVVVSCAIYPRGCHS
ncbi:hypothetical protein ABUL04_05825 [Micromonospora harpali]|uniref:Uncharacterized protein n=2 Tax=Micromonospora TaxID=1873 RepID=A0ABW1HQD1_9ACTN